MWAIWRVREGFWGVREWGYVVGREKGGMGVGVGGNRLGRDALGVSDEQIVAR